MDISTIESLLHQPEGSSLDFKSSQYRFQGGTDHQKSELVKDVLAMANSWARTDAFILIGVGEVKDGSRHEVLGISEHLDDASLQQFVNAKTNRTVVFSHESCQVDGKTIGILKIPKQPRPSYLTQDYAKLRAHTVFHRVGSSTAIATPEEVAKMIAADSAEVEAVPCIDVEFADEPSRQQRGRSLICRSDMYQFDPSKLRDYSDQPSGPFLALRPANRDYYRELGNYVFWKSALTPIWFAVTNRGSVLAQNLSLEFTIDEPDVMLLDASSFPRRPAKRYNMLNPRISDAIVYARDTSVKKHGGTWRVCAEVGNVKPKETIYTSERFYIGKANGASLTVSVAVLGENLPNPQQIPLTFQFECTHHSAPSLQQLEKLAGSKEDDED